MKKLIILLVAAYIGLIAFQFYKKVQTNKIWTDEKWQYFMKVIYNSDFSQSFDTYRFTWNGDFRILIDEAFGKPSQEDKIALERAIKQLNTLIFPRKITLNQVERSRRTVTKMDANIFMCFTKKGRDICPCKGLWHDSIPGLFFQNNWESKGTMRGSVTNYKLHIVYLNIRTDSNDQTKRNGLILKELTYALLSFSNQPQQDWVSHLDKDGHIERYQLDNPLFPNSIFNTRCNNCSELAEVDKFIIKTYYSQGLEETIASNFADNYIEKNRLFSTISAALLVLIVLMLYFSGYFHRFFISYIDSRIKLKWIAFNTKALTIFLAFSIIYVISVITIYYIYLSGLKYDAHIPKIGTQVYKLVHVLLFLLAYLLIPINFVYITEKIVFPKFEQFAKQQLFSFIALEAGVIIANYILMHLLVPMYDGDYMIYVGAGFGIVRFLFNYSNYQRKLALINKEQELTQLRELKTRAELNALQSKINPHFLYNALNSIAGLAHENANKVEQMALALSKLFRYSINKEDDDFNTVQNEVEMVSIYLDIEKVRFGDKLQYQVTLPKELEKERIPKFIIQPLVENAIKHGISQITTAGLLTLKISKIDTSLKIMVSDNGPDFPEDLMTGYGLQNIYEKLDILYHKRYEVTLQNGSKKNISVTLKNA